MNIKGHTKIQLFNAKTGELEQQVEEDNMVTNAVAKLLNLPTEFYLGNTSLTGITNSVLPIATKSMGGVLLFSNKRTENANLFETNGNDAVGHAGTVYSGTNAYTGTLNTNESKALTNGYRLVWDFATDRANGDISCVCLTSRAGGSIGLNDSRDTTSDNYKEQPGSWNNYSSGWASIFDLGSGADNKIAAFVEKGVYATVSCDNGVQISYYRCINPQKIDLKWSNTTVTTNAPFKTYQVQLTYPATDKNNWYVDSNGILRMMQVRYNRDSTNNNDTLYVRANKINIITGKVLLDENIELDINSFPSDFLIKRETRYQVDYIYVFALMENFLLARFKKSDNQWYIASLGYDGKFIKEYTNYKSSTSSWSYGSLYDLSQQAHFYASNLWIDESGDIVKLGKHTEDSTYINRHIYVYQDIFPYYLCQYGSYNTARLYVGRNNTYLATINNLATTVTKTSAQTMKITYDLIES